jgi:hypothetical protein
MFIIALQGDDALSHGDKGNAFVLAVGHSLSQFFVSEVYDITEVIFQRLVIYFYPSSS